MKLYSMLSWDQFAELIGGEVIENPDINALAVGLGDAIEMERGGDMVTIRLNQGQAPHLIIRADNLDGHGALGLIVGTDMKATADGIKTIKEQMDGVSTGCRDRHPLEGEILRPKRKIYGWSEQELSDAFDLIKDKDDWKDPISATIPANKFEIAAAACVFYTSTVLEYEEADEADTCNVHAVGYRMGPAGDH
jgi:hypothetical protein